MELSFLHSWELSIWQYIYIYIYVCVCVCVCVCCVCVCVGIIKFHYKYGKHIMMHAATRDDIVMRNVILTGQLV